MKTGDFSLMADENVDAEVISFLRNHGFDVLDVREANFHGTTDLDLLRLAVGQQRLIVTHDGDFGMLAIRQGEPVIGIIYIRPGHISPAFTIETIRTILDRNPEVEAPFLLVARRKATTVTIRLRNLEG